MKTLPTNVNIEVLPLNYRWIRTERPIWDMWTIFIDSRYKDKALECRFISPFMDMFRLYRQNVCDYFKTAIRDKMTLSFSGSFHYDVNYAVNHKIYFAINKLPAVPYRKEKEVKKDET